MHSTSAPEASVQRPTLTVAVLAYNEAHGIAQCLRSAAFADQLLVVDGGSSDATVELARQCGAQVHIYPDWQGFAVQRNRLIAHATGDYIFFLDADEVMSPAFAQELQAIVASGARAVWTLRWRMVAFGRELRHLRMSTQVERLFRRDQLLQYVGVVHEQAQLVPGAEPLARIPMRERLLHYARPSVGVSLDKLKQYALLGAAKRAQAGRRGGVLRGMAAGVSMFVRLYLLRLGFLCGGAGFLYCFFIALEAFFRYAALHYDRESLSDCVPRAGA